MIMTAHLDQFGLKINLNCGRNKFALSFICIMTAAVFTNISVLLVFMYKRKYRKSYHKAYMNLAMSDAAMALFGAIFRGRSEQISFLTHSI